MGPELILAIAGPFIGGAVSIFVWSNKRNYDTMTTGFSSLNTTVNVIERKMDDLRVDVAKNYVSTDDLLLHIKNEEEWHNSMGKRMDEIVSRVEEFRNSLDRIHFGEDPRG